MAGSRAVRRFALAMVLGLGALLVPQGAQAQSTAYGGAAHTDLVHANALNLPGTIQLAEAAVAKNCCRFRSIRC
jgi:hypothetical protein